MECPVDCVIHEWHPYSACSASCGGGTQSRIRTVTEPKHGGLACPATTETHDCNTMACPVDCELGDWTGWTACSATCGPGVTARSREITRLQSDGGVPCPAILHEDEACEVEACPTPKPTPEPTIQPTPVPSPDAVDCVVGDWTAFTECSQPCGPGVKTRTRPLIEAQFGGQECPSGSEQQNCNVKPCPVDCVVNDWLPFSECTATCGGGQHTRNRGVVAPQHGGAECPKTTETQECNSAPCPAHCEVTEWTEWSPCSVSCGHGSHSRSRAEVVSPAHGGEACPALHQEGFCGEPCPSDTPACEFFSYKFKDTSKWHFNMKVECPACPVTGVRVKLPNGLWAGTFPHWDPEYEGYYHVNNVEIVFPLTVRLVSGSGAVGEEIEETIQELVNDQPIEGTKQFKRGNAEEPAAVQPAFDCIVGVCVTPATILHAIDQYGPPGGLHSHRGLHLLVLLPAERPGMRARDGRHE